MEHLPVQSENSGGQYTNDITNASADSDHPPLDSDNLISTQWITSIQERANAVVTNPTVTSIDITRSTSLTPWNTNSESFNSEDPFYELESDHRLSLSTSKGKLRCDDRNSAKDMDPELYWKTKYETLKMAYDMLSSRVGSQIVAPSEMIHGTNYPNLPLDLNVTGMMDTVDHAFVPLDPPNHLNSLDYLEPVATGPGLDMEGSSAQANPIAFSMNALDILQFSQSLDSVSAGPSTSKSTVKTSRRMRVGKSKTARNLCAADWKRKNPKGTTDEFAEYYQNISTEEKLKYKKLEFQHKLTGDSVP